MKARILDKYNAEDCGVEVNGIVEAKYFKDLDPKFKDDLRDSGLENLWKDNDIFVKDAEGDWLYMYDEEVEILPEDQIQK